MNAATSIIPFENEEFGVIRALRDETGEPWFVAKDVCDALGIATNHLREDGRGLDEDEVLSLPNWEGKGSAPLIVSEPGFYKLVMRSRKPEAKAFQRWVTHEVFPSIRKRGGYMVEVPNETPEQTMARAILIARDTIERQRADIDMLTGENAVLAPKAAMADAFLDADGAYTITQASGLLRQLDGEGAGVDGASILRPRVPTPAATRSGRLDLAPRGLRACGAFFMRRHRGAARFISPPPWRRAGRCAKINILDESKRAGRI